MDGLDLAEADMTKAAVKVTGNDFLPRVNAKAIFRWCGSKRWAVPILCPIIHDYLSKSNGAYFEPFLGGASIALDLGLPNMVLNDTCKPLIETYQTIRRSPEAVAWAAQTLVERGIDKESYLKVRASAPTSIIFAAARFVYLSAYSFNGLYRENKSGTFNVPFGGDKLPTAIPDVERLKAVANAFATSELLNGDFRDVVARLGNGDFAYIDSPYYDTFANYTAGGFTEDDHVALCSALRAAKLRGAAFIASNTDCKRIRELYDWAKISCVTERNSVGATAERRVDRSAVFIASHARLLPS